MGIPIIRLIFDRRKRASKSSKGAVEILFATGGKRKYFATGILLFSEQWSDKKWVINSLESVALNQTLESMLSIVREYALECMKQERAVDFAVVSSLLKGGGIKRNVSFIEWAEELIASRKDIGETTRKQHFSMLRTLETFGGIKEFADITKRNIMAWDDFLHNKGIAQTSIYGYHKRLKVYISQAVKRELLAENPYTYLSFDRGKSATRRYLTTKEIERLKNCKLPTESLRQVRDLFLFQCYTGLAYSDFAKFNFAKDVLERNGKYVIKDTRLKTDEEYTIVLLSPAVELLKRYDYRLPMLSNVKYNLYLKAIAQHAGLEKDLTTHMGRHSFAVFALNAGVPIEVVAKMMGHSDIKTTQIYAKVLDTAVEAGFEQMEETLL